MTPDSGPKVIAWTKLPELGNREAVANFKKGIGEKLSELSDADKQKVRDLMKQKGVDGKPFGIVGEFEETHKPILKEILQVINPEARFKDDEPFTDSPIKGSATPIRSDSTPVVATGRKRAGTSVKKAPTSTEPKPTPTPDVETGKDSGESEADSKQGTAWADRDHAFKEKFKQRGADDLLSQIDTLQELINQYRKNRTNFSHTEASVFIEGFTPSKLNLGKLKRDLERRVEDGLNEQDYEYIYGKRVNIAQYLNVARNKIRDLESPDEPDEPGEPENETYKKTRLAWLGAKRDFNSSEEIYFSDANKTELQQIERRLSETNKIGRLLNKTERAQLLERKAELDKNEVAYQEAKKKYFHALHDVLEERKNLDVSGHDALKPSIKEFRSKKDGTSLEETSDEILNNKGFDRYRPTIATHLFAKRGVENGTAGRDMRSSHDKEQEFRESILSERKLSVFKKTEEFFRDRSKTEKMLFAGAIMAGSWALNGLSPTRMLVSVTAGFGARGLMSKIGFSDENMKKYFGKKTEIQRAQYDGMRRKTETTLGPGSYDAIVTQVEAEADKFRSVTKTQEAKLQGAKYAKKGAVMAAGIGAGAGVGQFVDFDAVDKAIIDGVKDVFSGESTGPGVNTGTPLTEDELPVGVTTGTPLTEASSSPSSPEVVSSPSVESSHAVVSESEIVEKTVIESSSIPAQEQHLSIPDQYEGNDTLSEALYEQFKAGDLEGFEDVSKAEFLNKMYTSLDILKDNDKILELMSIEGHRPLENFDLVYRYADAEETIRQLYNVQPLIDHMNGLSVSEIEMGTHEQTVAKTVDVSEQIPSPTPAAPDFELPTAVEATSDSPTTPSLDTLTFESPEAAKAALTESGLGSIDRVILDEQGRPMVIHGALENLERIHPKLGEVENPGRLFFNHAEQSITAYPTDLDGAIETVTKDMFIAQGEGLQPDINLEPAPTESMRPQVRPELNLDSKEGILSMLKSEGRLSLFEDSSIKNLGERSGYLGSYGYLFHAQEGAQLRGLEVIDPRLTDDLEIRNMVYTDNGELTNIYDVHGNTVVLEALEDNIPVNDTTEVSEESTATRPEADSASEVAPEIAFANGLDRVLKTEGTEVLKQLYAVPVEDIKTAMNSGDSSALKTLLEAQGIGLTPQLSSLLDTLKDSLVFEQGNTFEESINRALQRGNIILEDSQFTVVKSGGLLLADTKTSFNF